MGGYTRVYLTEEQYDILYQHLLGWKNIPLFSLPDKLYELGVVGRREEDIAEIHFGGEVLLVDDWVLGNIGPFVFYIDVAVA